MVNSNISSLLKILCISLLFYFVLAHSSAIDDSAMDAVVEDEITQMLTDDFIDSISKKFHADMERAVEMVLSQVRTLLQNGTTHVRNKLLLIQDAMKQIKMSARSELPACEAESRNTSSSLAARALHQMVLCGYALIGHDPAHSLVAVMEMKDHIRKGVQEMRRQRTDIYILIKKCGHIHVSLHTMVKCVISASTMVQSVMTDITNKLLNGIVDLTKLVAHGAMYEACLIEVIQSVENEAIVMVQGLKDCTLSKNPSIQNQYAINGNIEANVLQRLLNNYNVTESKPSNAVPLIIKPAETGVETRIESVDLRNSQGEVLEKIPSDDSMVQMTPEGAAAIRNLLRSIQARRSDS